MSTDLQVAPEIIEDANEVAIQIGGYKFAQLPRFVLGRCNDVHVCGLPLREEFVYLSPAVEIQPEKDRTDVAVRRSKRAIGDKQSATSPRDAGNPVLVAPPIARKAQCVDVIGSGFGRRWLRGSQG